MTRSASPNDFFIMLLGLLLVLPAASHAQSGPGKSPRVPFSPRFISIPAGSFIMGSPETEHSSRVDETQHEVILTRPFLLASTEVTQGLWQTVTGENPSYFAPCDSCPVDRVSWLDAVEFCNAYSAKERLEPAYVINGQTVRWIRESNGFRLPTEAEWEYACRAGSRTTFAAGPCLLTEQGNYNGYHPLWRCPPGMNRGEPIEVGRLTANGWGLRDMHGNISEWCWDAYGDYPPGPVQDPTGLVDAGPEARRVFRGGCFINFGPKCRSANREALDPAKRLDMLGLRLARSGRKE